MTPFRLTATALVLSLLGTACGWGGGAGEAGSEVAASVAASGASPTVERVEPVPAEPEPTAIGSAEPVAADPEASGPEAPGLSPLADLVVSVGDLRHDPDAIRQELGPNPVAVTIDGIDVTEATIRDVGVEPNGEMEIPGATEVGWYRWSPTPGSAGSSVLAAHIAFNGRDGVFRDLDDVEVGERIVVRYDDGSSREFVTTETAQYDKAALPFDRIFSKVGDPSLVLITCGGDFNRALNSYEDNVVVYAVPV